MTALIASADGIDMGRVLLDLFLVLAVAKLAAEAAERMHVPAVLGEICAGILLGPSVLGFVSPSDTLTVLAELGVIVLLATVGLETDLDHLRRVGRASLWVAAAGVVVPMTTGFGAGVLFGESVNASMFLGAALAATSVGITARVFGDLRALSSTEARIVLGAAVADDVLGLVILTVVTRIVEQGSVDVAGIGTTLALATGFLGLAGLAGIFLVPRMFALVGRRSSSGATVGVIAAALVFLFSALADAAHLAPIIGAFVAGTALGRTDHHERIARDMSTLGNYLVPVFFLMIGTGTDVSRFLQWHVIAVASVLTVIAVGGKVVAGFAAAGTRSDRLLIGLGMIPRGEVGLIFASIGVSTGVFDDDLHAVVLLVVLATTVIAPPLLRWRITANDVPTTGDGPDVTAEPAGGWIVHTGARIELDGVPPAAMVLALGLDTALAAADNDVGPGLVEWLHARRDVPLAWDPDTTGKFLELLVRGNARSWRLLEMTNILDRALPEFAAAMEARRSDSTELDPTRVTRFAVLESLHARFREVTPENSPLLLAALLTDLGIQGAQASAMLSRLGLPAATEKEAVSLVSASTLLAMVATTVPYDKNPRVMAQLAEFLATPQAVERCRILTEARMQFDEGQYSLLLDVTTGVQTLLAHPELIEGLEDSLESVRRREAMALTDDPLVIDRITHADAGYVISHDPATIVRHARLVEPAPRGRTVRVSVTEGARPSHWTVDIATRDMKGLLARIASVLAERGLEIVTADLATWPDGAVLDTFTVRSESVPNGAVLAFALEQSMRRRVASPRRIQAGTDGALAIDVDNDAHPWHSLVVVTGRDRPGLLQTVAAAFARAGINVHHARLTTDNGIVTDRFEVSDRHGRRISRAAVSQVIEQLS